MIQSVVRAFAILRQFSKAEPELGLTTIASRAGLIKGTCFSLLYTLVKLGYIQQNPVTSRYSLGLRTFELGQAYLACQDLCSLAKPHLRRLAEQTHEAVHLAKIEGRTVVYIDEVEDSHAITVSSRIGRPVKVHCTSVGKAMLAHLPESDLAGILSGSMEPCTENTIIDQAQLRGYLKAVREIGYAIDDEEVEVGLRCVGAPIFNARNQVVAAVSITGPTGRIPRERFESMGQAVRNTAREISRNLGNGLMDSPGDGRAKGA